MKWLSWFRRSDRVTSTTLAASEEDFLWLEGRRHAQHLPYLMPQDAQETQRLDFQHYLIRYTMQRNYIAPLRDPRGILDVGCGTGRWALEMASAFPQAKVFGLDILNDHQIPLKGVPNNYRFVKGDVLEELPFPDRTFDFVHQRFLHAAIPVYAWSHVVAELKRVTRPGGWVELAESDQMIHNGGPAMRQLTGWGLEWSRARGIDTRVCAQLPQYLEEAGLKHIQCYRVDLPLGRWGGRIGHMTATDMYAYNRAIKPMLVAQLGIDPASYDNATAAMLREWEINHCFFSFYVMCGQRLT